MPIKTDGRSFSLILTGGANAGIFSAGILSAFQEMNIYPRIKAVYGGSSGAMNSAFFLTKNMESGSGIYIEDLTHDFEFPHRIPYGIAQRYWSRYIKRIPEKNIKQVVDIEYVMNILRQKDKLDYIKLKHQRIPFYVNLFNISKGRNEYVPIDKAEPEKILRAAVSIAPYTTRKEDIGGDYYIDGTITEPIGLEHVLEENPEGKIVVLLNSPLRWSTKHYIKALIEYIAAVPMYGNEFAKRYFSRIGYFNKDVETAMNNPNILILHPPKINRAQPRTTDPEKLMETYELGREEAKKITGFL